MEPVPLPPPLPPTRNYTSNGILLVSCNVGPNQMRSAAIKPHSRCSRA
ncbi:unnamed protein product [Brassica oleracea]